MLSVNRIENEAIMGTVASASIIVEWKKEIEAGNNSIPILTKMSKKAQIFREHALLRGIILKEKIAYPWPDMGIHPAKKNIVDDNDSVIYFCYIKDYQ